MRIAIFGNNYQASHLEELRAFLYLLKESDNEIFIESEFAAYLAETGFDPGKIHVIANLPDDADIAVSIGGDGTFLQTAEWVGSRQIPIMGINTGHLGYLAGFSFDRPQEIKDALEGRYEISPRMVLMIDTPFLPPRLSPFALNEVSISKGDTTSMVEIKATVNGLYLADYLADGLVVSTPTGSTAYNLSCGGPILEPTLDSIILSPIAPHSLTLRPVVVGAGSKLCFNISSRGDECHIGVDGRTFAIPSNGTEIKISAAPYKVNVVQPKGMDFASVLRNKLGWGGGF